MQNKTSADNIVKYFFFILENRLWHPMQIVSKETICMECHSLCSGKNKENMTKLSSAEFSQRVIKLETVSVGHNWFVQQLFLDLLIIRISQFSSVYHNLYDRR